MLGKIAFTNKIVAKNLSMPEDRVNQVMSFFITELKDEIGRAQHPFIYVRGLGTFAMNLKPVENKLRRFIRYYSNTKKGKGIRNNEKSLLALRQTIFDLYRIRRLIKAKQAELKGLKKDKHVLGKA